MAFKLRSSVVTVRRLLKYFRLEAFPTQTRELIMVVVARSDLQANLTVSGDRMNVECEIS